MRVHLKAYRTGETQPVHDCEHIDAGDNALTSASNMLMDILEGASGRFTETSELTKLGIERVEIRFIKVKRERKR